MHSFTSLLLLNCHLRTYFFHFKCMNAYNQSPVSRPCREQNITDAGEKSKDEAAVGTERSEVDAVHPRLKQDKSIEDEGVEKRKKDSIIG